MNNVRKPVLDVLRGKIPERLPVWLMRQAGRYLPEYREIRAKSKNFLNMALTPELAVEITLQPIRRFGMDAAILFADILLVPMALGLGLEFKEGEGPVLERLEDFSSLDRLIYTPKSVEPVFAAVRGVQERLPEKCALIGFCGSPWTVACYMIDGNSRQNFARAQEWAKEKPDQLRHLIGILIEASEDYLSAQIEAGAEVIQLFDSWAGLLQGQAFTDFVIEPTRDLVARLKKKHPDIPVIGFPREAGAFYAPYVRQTGIDGLSIDFSIDPDMAKRELQSVKPLQGNLDPALLVRGGAEMRQALEKIIGTFGKKHIVNLGHGVVPETPPAHVAELVQIVREWDA